MKALREFFEQVRGLDQFQVVSTLMILGVILHAPQVWVVHIPAILVGLGVLLLPQVRTSMWAWYVMGLFVLFGCYMTWYEADNHKYLVGYGCLMVSAALCGEDRITVLNRQAAILLGLVMLLAVLWKAVSADYLSGDFFRLTLLTDTRFADFAHSLTGVSMLELQLNHVDLATYQDPLQEVMNPIALRGIAKAEWLVQAMTWWTILIELALAVFFIVPWRDCRWTLLKHASLLAFMVSTYAVATVSGFAWMLVVLAYASTREEESIYRPFYLAALVLIQIYTAPFI